MTALKSLAAAVFAVAVFLSPAHGQPLRECGEHSSMVVRLLTAYGEQLVAIGVGSGNVLVEVFASEDGRTWSILVVQPTGIACLLAAGEHWQDNREPEGERS